LLLVFPPMNEGSRIRRFSGCSTRLNPGFTLIELIVVIAIIAVLAVLITPSLQRGIQTANQSRCVGNLKGLIQGWSLYCGEHNGTSVDGGASDSSAAKYGYSGWISQLWPYLGQGNINKLITCPSASKPNPSDKHGTARYAWKSDDGKSVGSYGFNARWLTYAPGAFADYDTSPDSYYKKQMNGLSKEGPVISDATWVTFDRGSGPPTDFDTGAGSTSVYGIVRHGGKGVNMAFADGGVRLVSMGEVFSTLKLRPGDIINAGWINSVPAQYR